MGAQSPHAIHDPLYRGFLCAEFFSWDIPSAFLVMQGGTDFPTERLYSAGLVGWILVSQNDKRGPHLEIPFCVMRFRMMYGKSLSR